MWGKGTQNKWGGACRPPFLRSPTLGRGLFEDIHIRKNSIYQGGEVVLGGKGTDSQGQRGKEEPRG